MNRTNDSLSLANSQLAPLDGKQKIALVFAGLAILCLLFALLGWSNGNPLPFMLAFFTSGAISVALYTNALYGGKTEGIKNDGVWFRSFTSKGTWAWIFGIVITGFYVALYWFPQWLGYNDGGTSTSLVRLFDPLSFAITGQAATQWFLYGALYTFLILILGAKFIVKYRNNRYQIIRTVSVMFFQLCFAFMLPEILKWFNSDLPWMDLKNMWPLNYYFFDSYNLNALINPEWKNGAASILNPKTGWFGLGLLLFGLAMVLVISPILTYFFGKRWYCSWVCGCGGLAETAGDSFRHLSDKSMKAWKVERWMIHSVLVFVTIMTAWVIYTYFTGKDLLGISSNGIRQTYGFLIGAAFSGVVGVGFYPLMGSRVWCRFGCPMAAILGIQQKFFSRFRITTNGGQCISCGNCSTHCEMGIDVKAYAQKGQNIVRASCVGCGICAAVCPRGVLKLENGPTNDKTEVMPFHIGRDEVTVLN